VLYYSTMRESRKSNEGKANNFNPVSSHTTTRKVVQCGKSFYIGLPLKWVKQHGVNKGEKMGVVCEGGLLKIIPQG